MTNIPPKAVEQGRSAVDIDVPYLNVTDTQDEIYDKVVGHFQAALDSLAYHIETGGDADHVDDPDYAPHVSVRLSVVLHGLTEKAFGGAHPTLYLALANAWKAAEEVGATIVDVEGYGLTNSSRSGLVLSLRVVITPRGYYPALNRVMSRHLARQVSLAGGLSGGADIH